MVISYSDQLKGPIVSPETRFLFMITIIWPLAPFLDIFIIILGLLVIDIKFKWSSVKYICFLISVSFALLAFTQKSLAAEDTDIIRYYNSIQGFVDGKIGIVMVFLADDILTFTFTPLSILVVKFLGHIQYFSFFWTFVIYWFFFLSIIKVSRLEWPYICQSSVLALFIFFSCFGAILFTQVTETIKSAAAISLFFYVLAKLHNRDSIISIIFIYILIIGIHSQVLLYLPLLFYKKIPLKVSIIILLCSIISATFINVAEIAMNLLPVGGKSMVLTDKLQNYSLDSGKTSTVRYIGESIVILVLTVYLEYKYATFKKNKFNNLIFLYIAIMYINFNNSVAFIRMANFSSFILCLLFIPLIKNKVRFKLGVIYMCIIVWLNYKMTISRTLVPNGYCSSYMDNSVTNILFSNVLDFLLYRIY